MRFAFAVIGIGALIGIAAACSDDDTPSDQVASPDGGPLTTGSTCPCVVSGVTISCGGAQCISGKGYRCEDDGAHEDDSICSSASGSTTSSTSSSGGCPLRTCQELGASCGTPSDSTCGPQNCGTCTNGQYCSQALGGEFRDDVAYTNFNCFTKATNVVVFGAVQGGTFTIDVDENLPNLAIGLTGESAMNVTVTGQYAANVVAVYSASSWSTQITGVPTAKSFLSVHPQLKLSDAGVESIDCEEPDGGDAGTCNPAADVGTFFTNALGGTLVFNRCQDAAFSGTLKISEHGTCN